MGNRKLKKKTKSSMIFRNTYNKAQPQNEFEGLRGKKLLFYCAIVCIPWGSGGEGGGPLIAARSARMRVKVKVLADVSTGAMTRKSLLMFQELV